MLAPKKPRTALVGFTVSSSGELTFPAQTCVVETCAAARLLALVGPTFIIRVRPQRALLFLLHLGSRHASCTTAQKLSTSRPGIRRDTGLDSWATAVLPYMEL
jgi:hypothetical protein